MAGVGAGLFRVLPPYWGAAAPDVAPAPVRLGSVVVGTAGEVPAAARPCDVPDNPVPTREMATTTITAAAASMTRPRVVRGRRERPEAVRRPVVAAAAASTCSGPVAGASNVCATSVRSERNRSSSSIVMGSSPKWWPSPGTAEPGAQPAGAGPRADGT